MFIDNGIYQVAASQEAKDAKFSCLASKRGPVTFIFIIFQTTAVTIDA